MFPWQSGSDGREESPELHLNPRSGRWNPDPSHRAHHIGIAIAYNVWQFYQVTGDLAYLIDYGAELLAESAILGQPGGIRRGAGPLRHLRGHRPRRAHSGYPDRPFDGIDNNAYTNVMAVWVILRAFEALELLPLPNRIDLREQLGLTDEELAQWDHVSRRMFVPFHDGVISQFEGYDKLAELDWDDYRARYGNIQRLDRILEAEEDDVNRYRASKQADALMLLYLLSSDELSEVLDRLDYRSALNKSRRWSTTTLLAPRTARRSAAWFIPGCSPAPIAIARWSSSARAQVRHRRHPGRHHLRGHSPRRDGRQRRPDSAVLHRAGDARRPDRAITALAGISWRTGISDPLPGPTCTRAGQRKGRGGQRGSARCAPQVTSNAAAVVEQLAPGCTIRFPNAAFLGVERRSATRRSIPDATDHRQTGGLNNRRADRTQTTAGEAPKTVASDHSQLRVIRPLDELTCRLDPNHDGDGPHVGILFLPPRQALGENFLLDVLGVDQSTPGKPSAPASLHACRATSPHVGATPRRTRSRWPVPKPASRRRRRVRAPAPDAAPADSSWTTATGQ